MTWRARASRPDPDQGATRAGGPCGPRIGQRSIRFSHDPGLPLAFSLGKHGGQDRRVWGDVND
jgi:hypothetical protein